MILTPGEAQAADPDNAKKFLRLTHRGEPLVTIPFAEAKEERFADPAVARESFALPLLAALLNASLELHWICPAFTPQSG